MASTEITFDKLVYIDRLKSAGVAEPQARAHAEALDQALRDTVATKRDLRDLGDELRNEIRDVRTVIASLENKIDNLDKKIDNTVAVAVRDLKIWVGGIVIVAFGALVSIKFFG
jgi:predicted  nucleic acid-binding Zn-ribbon protein